MPLGILWGTKLTTSETTSQEQLGVLREESNGKLYKYVKFITASVVAGDAVKYLTVTKKAAYQVEPKNTQAAVVAGVAVADQAINDYGWIQVRGSVTLSATGTDTPVVGDAAISSGTTKKLANWSAEFAPCGVWENASTGVILDCAI